MKMWARIREAIRDANVFREKQQREVIITPRPEEARRGK